MNEKRHDSVLVIDDHKMIVHGIELLIGEQFRHFYTAHDGAGGISMALRYRPALIIIDFSLPDTTGDQVVQKIRGKIPDARFLVYSFNFNAEAIHKLFFARVN